jgi:hypothetical protein
MTLHLFGELRMAGEIPEMYDGQPGGGGDLLPNYGNPHRASPEVILPSTGEERRGSGGNNAWGSWANVGDPTTQPLVLLAAHINRVATTRDLLWIQVGADPAGGTNYAPVAIFAIHAYISGSGAYPVHGSHIPLPPITITAGSSLAFRAWGTGTGNHQFQGYLALLPTSASWYDPWPNTYITGARVSSIVRTPTVPTLITVDDTYTQVLAAAPNAMLLTALEADFSTDGAPGQTFEVGVGPASYEVLFSRVGIPSTRLASGPYGYQTFARKALILPGERVAVRSVTALSHPIALYLENLI